MKSREADETISLREETVLRLREAGLTRAEIAGKFRVDGSRISQITAKANRKLARGALRNLRTLERLPEGGHNAFERRCLCLDSAELRINEDGDEYRVAGRAAVFNSRSVDLGGFVEVIEPGFFSGVTAGDTRLLLNHDANFTLGRVPKTLTVSETGSALEIDGRLSKTERNLGFVIDPMRRGDVTGMSFGFRVKPGGDRWEEQEDGTMLRTLLPGGCAELPDVSIVTFPAYPQTSAAVRSLERWRAEHPPTMRHRLGLRARALQIRGDLT